MRQTERKGGGRRKEGKNHKTKSEGKKEIYRRLWKRNPGKQELNGYYLGLNKIRKKLTE